MTVSGTPPYFDGHNDVLTRLLQYPEAERVRAFLDGDGTGHLDLPRMRDAGFAGGFFAFYVPSPETGGYLELMRGASYDVPLPAPIDRQFALDHVLTQCALLLRIEHESQGVFAVCRSLADLRGALERGQVAAIMHIEGVEAFDTGLDALAVMHAAGLRSLGPVWSRPNAFGHGVPFRFPGAPDTGPGLTQAGKDLVRECNALKVMIDLSHLNEQGFLDVARLSSAPLVATHSNAHALSACPRNLTDSQLAAIRDSDGLVGVNFATAFIRPDGQMDASTSLQQLLAHVSHMIERLGEDRVGFGSDYDGALIPTAIGDVTGIDAIREAMREHGFDEPLMTRLFHGNWLAVLERTWGS